MEQHLKAQGWTQAEAAKGLGVTQARVSRLINGNWQDFSLNMLLTLAAEDMAVTFSSCMPEAERLFDMLLAAPPSDAHLTVLEVVFDSYGDTIDRVLPTKQ